MKPLTVIKAFVLVCLAASELVQAQEELFYYRVPLGEVTIDRPSPDQAPSKPVRHQYRIMSHYWPYAAVEQGRAYIDSGDESIGLHIYEGQSIAQFLDRAQLIIETNSQSAPAGALFVPRADLSGMERIGFKVKSDAKPLSGEEGRKVFATAMRRHYDRLLEADFTGAAWFRYQSLKAAGGLEGTTDFDPNMLRDEDAAPERDPFASSYDLFTGQQAISENIQLDRRLQVLANQPRTLAIESVEGITTKQIDWKPLIKDAKIELDPLAAYVPADQHAFFYPTFRRMMDFVDAVKDGRQTVEAAGFSVAELEFYEQQMCVWLDGWSRFWGPKTIHGVALTGSDPYMGEGTDSAILFDAKIGKLVYGNTESKQDDKLKTVKDARLLNGSVEGVEYRALVSPDRQVCSYLAQIDNVVVVTNSLAQLQKIAQASQKKIACMRDLDEYKFFRQRYNTKENEQTAMVVLTDAAIRRWCSPKWRIGTARRRFAAAAMSHMQAAWIDEGQAFDAAQAQGFLNEWVNDIGEVTITDAGITSAVYGNMRFMTPIIELDIDKISQEEQQQYERFRGMYQRQWRNFFDPVAVCFLHEPGQTNVDLSVRPLIAASEYRQWMAFGGKNTIQQGDGDPHAEAIAQLIFAVDRDSEPVRQAGQFVNTFMPLEGQLNAFGWLGRWVTVYADDSPFWQELSKHLAGSEGSFDEYLEENADRIPVAIAAEVENPAKLAVFLVAIRAWIQQTVPNMTTWETLSHKEQSYVKVAVRYDAEAEQPPAVYYAALPNQLVISPNEALIQRAIDRSLSKKKRGDDKDWAGRNIAVSMSEAGWKAVELLVGQSYSRWLQRQAWNNLPILTEWQTKKKAGSEAEFHERFWFTPLSYPAGTEYVWNENWKTVESTLFGHPGEPKLPEAVTPVAKMKQADLGITFEEDGLRAVIKTERRKK